MCLCASSNGHEDGRAAENSRYLYDDILGSGQPFPPSVASRTPLKRRGSATFQMPSWRYLQPPINTNRNTHRDCAPFRQRGVVSFIHSSPTPPLIARARARVFGCANGRVVKQAVVTLGRLVAGIGGDGEFADRAI